MVTWSGRGRGAGLGPSLGAHPPLQSEQLRCDGAAGSYACAPGLAPPPAGPGLRGNTADWSWGSVSLGSEERLLKGRRKGGRGNGPRYLHR